MSSMAIANRLSEDDSGDEPILPPNGDPPNARRSIASKLARAAVVTGDTSDSERDVVAEGSGKGTWVARNI